MSECALQSGLAGWLFGALSNARIALPEKLNLSGIFSLIAQILDVTWQTIKARVIKLLGPKAERVMDQVEKAVAVAVVADFITRGPIALFEMAKEFIGDLKTRFFDSITEIAAGNLKKAIIAVENSLAKALPVAIGFTR